MFFDGFLNWEKSELADQKKKQNKKKTTYIHISSVRAMAAVEWTC